MRYVCLNGIICGVKKCNLSRMSVNTAPLQLIAVAAAAKFVLSVVYEDRGLNVCVVAAAVAATVAAFVVLRIQFTLPQRQNAVHLYICPGHCGRKRNCQASESYY